MARLIVLASAVAVGLCQAAVLRVKTEYDDLSVALQSRLAHNKKVFFLLIPNTLVCKGDSALFLPCHVRSVDNLSQTSVRIAADDIDSAALQSCHYHVLVGAVRCDEDRILAADLDGV